MYRHASGCESVLDRIFQATKLLEKHGVGFNVLTVVINNIAAHIKEIYGFYRKQNWGYQQYIVCLGPLDEEHGKNPYALSPERYKDLLITLFHLRYEGWKKGRQPYIRQPEGYIGILIDYRPGVCDQCDVCNTQNAAEADDSIYPYDFYVLDEYRLGNFSMDQLDNIDRRRQETGFAGRSKRLKDLYLSCSCYNICRGGYRRSRDLDPEDGPYDNYFCEGYHIFFDACLPLMGGIAKKQSIERQVGSLLH